MVHERIVRVVLEEHRIFRIMNIVVQVPQNTYVSTWIESADLLM